MTLFATSKGVLARKKTVSACFDESLKPFKTLTKISATDSIVGWGFKPHSLKLKQRSIKANVNFLHLEDGFIGYIGHPAKGGVSVSLIADPLSMYYDSEHPSLLENLIATSLTNEQLIRVQSLIKQIVNHGITKYNCYPTIGENLTLPKSIADNNFDSYILLIDQIVGDQSIKYAQASENDFKVMLKQARELYPNSTIIIRSHPDTKFGKKRGVLANLPKSEIDNTFIFDDICHPHSLIHNAKAVFTVSSQMGFEALILGKKVYCFGVPFYAGWGLTQDSKTCLRRQIALKGQSLSIEQLVYAALVKYPKYFNPVTEERVEVESVIELIKLQQHSTAQWEKLYLVGFSFWKRSFIAKFCCHLASELVFTNQSPYKLIKSINSNEQIVVWGNKYADLTQVLRIEDGFIRSSGLGSNLCKPSSLCIDSLGMYFNAQRVSQLENQLQNSKLSDKDYQNALVLYEALKKKKLSKYNLLSSSQFQPKNRNKFIVLVVGQVENDASILTGSPVIRSNRSLLKAVRESHPNSWIIYKPHPDVIAKNRTDDLALDTVKSFCDEVLLDVPLNQLFEHIDELHTMTSLSGFEALIQGVKVVCWGNPFYSGWGLTKDKFPLGRRTNKLDLPTLVYYTLNYPKYIDWNTELFTSPQEIISVISREKKYQVCQSKFKQWQIKGQHLLNALSYHLSKAK